MKRTREMFNALRKVIDRQEEQAIADIKKEADKRENTLKLLYFIKVYLFVVLVMYSCIV